ncbi:MAG: ABC transporter permease [Chloroflexi bacterium]|nr:ABC transporter permease [Chloroflexota bacterium]
MVGRPDAVISPAYRSTPWRFPLGKLWRYVRMYPLGATGAFLFVALVVVGVLAPVLSPSDPMRVDYGRQLQPPSASFLMGSDYLGRDVLSRVLWGARTSLYIATLSVLVGQGGGTVLGMLGAYVGPKTDMVIQRFLDILMSLPGLVLAMVLVPMMGQSLIAVILAIGVVQAPRAARVMRSVVLSLKGQDFIQAARALGCAHGRILWRHISPNAFSPLLIIATAQLGTAILFEAALSFLGFGTPPPTPSWGRMLSSEGRDYFETAPWLAIFPGVAISLSVFAANLFGDALRDILDPRLRRA